jgi:hypothetical protein
MPTRPKARADGPHEDPEYHMLFGASVFGLWVVDCLYVYTIL